MTHGWFRHPPSNPGADLVRAASVAVARPEFLDAQSMQRRLSELVRAADGGDDAAFASSLGDAAPALLGYLLSFELEGAPQGFLRSYSGDAFCRFLHTLALTPRPLNGPVLEIGANPYLFHLLLRSVFPKASLAGSNFFDHDIFSTRVGSARHRLRNARLEEVLDFSFPTFNVETVHPYPYPAASFDLVFFCETLEHLVVNPLRVFREIRRILRPGGHLVLTLPNALRLTNVAAMLAGRNFFDLYQVGNGVHGRHNREFSLAEVRTLLERDGYEIVSADTRDRFDYEIVPIEAIDYSGPAAPLPFRKRDLESWIRRAGGRLEDRGDNIYVVARKPAEFRPARPALAAGDRLVSFLDALDTTADGLRVTGWAYFTDDATGEPGTAEIAVVGRERETRCLAEPMPRGDVAAAHGLEHDQIGFTALVPAPSLPEPPCEVRLRIRAANGAFGETLLGRWQPVPLILPGAADAEGARPG